MDKYKPYTMIGSRETPLNVLSYMENIAILLASDDFTLRSGGADGADSAAESGCDRAMGHKEIFLPWKGFNDNESQYFNPPEFAFDLAKAIHPAWFRCSQGAKRLHARNIQQILGEKLDSPSMFVVCWTKDGTPTGGTATAINLALQWSIPVYNLYHTYYLTNLEEITTKLFIEAIK